jgi:2-polyprenyl-6-methoxyphenol hydroxylase-like FAD-dependent oxidoreductase
VNQHRADLHVVVAGGGIAGNATALALRKAGIAATVVDPGSDGARGASLRLNPNAQDALRALDLHDDVAAASFRVSVSETWTRSGRRIGRLAARSRSRLPVPRAMAWSQLSELLGERAREAGVEFRSARVREVERTDDGVRAALSDGTSLTGTVLVGADGPSSTVRRVLNPHGPEPQHCRATTVRGFTPEPDFEVPPDEVVRVHLGARGVFVVLRDPASGGCFWTASMPTNRPMTAQERDPQRWRERLPELFEGDSAPVAAAVAGTDRIVALDDLALPHLPRWRDDRLVLVGDAVHVTSPAAEQGAGMALEDGATLARCLRDVPDTAEALGVYERLRRERAETVVALGAKTLRRAHERGLNQYLRRVGYRFQAWMPASIPAAGPKWTLDHHIDWNAPVARG